MGRIVDCARCNMPIEVGESIFVNEFECLVFCSEECAAGKITEATLTNKIIDENELEFYRDKEFETIPVFARDYADIWDDEAQTDIIEEHLDVHPPQIKVEDVNIKDKNKCGVIDNTEWLLDGIILGDYCLDEDLRAARLYEAIFVQDVFMENDGDEIYWNANENIKEVAVTMVGQLKFQEKGEPTVTFYEKDIKRSI